MKLRERLRIERESAEPAVFGSDAGSDAEASDRSRVCDGPSLSENEMLSIRGKRVKNRPMASTDFMAAIVILVLGCGFAVAFVPEAVAVESDAFVVTPAAAGEQLVRVSLPMSRGLLGADQSVAVEVAGRKNSPAGVRVISWYPDAANQPRSARRALVTFPWRFTDSNPVKFRLSVSNGAKTGRAGGVPVSVGVDEDVVRITWPGREPVELKLLVPVRTDRGAPRREVVENHEFYRWERFYFDDPLWPRVIEIRSDASGGVVVVAHLQRRDAAGQFAPGISWQMRTAARKLRSIVGGKEIDAGTNGFRHAFAEGVEATCIFDDAMAVYHPVAPLKRRGEIEAKPREAGGWDYRYVRCRAEDGVPMQPMAWERAEIAFGPPNLARLTGSLSSPHGLSVHPESWESLYGDLHALPKLPSELESLVIYHRDAIVRSAAVGDDYGNVTGYDRSSVHGGIFGMNRLNHAAAIFEDFRRSGDQRLRETALLWCDNFYDRSIWWGDEKRGGTRYNNVAANGQKPPNDRYMWRSNDSVSFCTKGYDSFFLAWEETGDPRMLEALEAQVAYAASHLHAYQTTCRNVGDVRDFVRLYSYTGERRYLDEALRLFRELRTRLSPDRLFSEGGDPLNAELPFIEDDQRGSKYGYAKPYIIGYALAGLPELIRLAPDEPDSKETVRAVADFLAATVDPAGGWRYPHPRSSSVLMSQAMEHAWQLTQAARVLGPEPKWLDAIETVLRARIHGWKRTGTILSGLQGWEVSTGKVKSRAELHDLYRKPEDRDAARDYLEGHVGYGSSPPEGLVYFGEVLGFYLKHRPIDRLMSKPGPDEPLGRILERSPRIMP